MKKTFRILALLMLVAVAALCMASCGVEEKVKGDWTTKTISGKTPAEEAAAKGLPEYTAVSNYTITSDEFKATTVGLDGNTATASMKIKFKSNGFECLDNDGNVAMSVLYNESDDTLSFKANAADGEKEYILKKGTTDIEAMKSAAQQPAEQAGESSEQAADGGEQAAEGGEEAAEGGEEAAE